MPVKWVRDHLGQLEIDGQAFDADAPAVILVDRDNLVFRTYTP